MCGRYVVATHPGQLALDFGAAELINLDRFQPDYNVAPTKPIPTVLTLGSARVLLEMGWGMVPSWAKDPAIGSRMINARVETVAEKPTFRRALVRRRCILPADGYYEWRKPAGAGGRKQPFYIHRTDGGLLAFAGLFDHWLGADGSELWTATIITGAAVGDLAAIHDRMPLTVGPGERDAWLDPDLQDKDEITALLDRDPEWTARPVSTLVNSVRNNGPELIAEEPEAPQEPAETAAIGRRTRSAAQATPATSAPEAGMDEPDTLF
ncbi:MAG TPA: SOS response-associated peptidase [Actinocrinis sp.]|nr:SOS response-associated peptidase [Actinocrinis sp.]